MSNVIPLNDLAYPGADASETEEDIHALEAEFTLLFGELPKQHAAFVTAFTDPHSTAKEAAVKAGYKESSAARQAHQLLRTDPIRRTVELARHLEQLRHGVALAYKRTVLIETIERCRRPGPDFNPNAVANLLDKLMKLDGDYPDPRLVGDGGGVSATFIQYNVQLPGSTPPAIDINPDD